MAGHSHWAGIKHKKAVVDAKKGKLFSKLAKNIISAARVGGRDIDTNLTLRYAIEKAKSFSMPKENIERAVKRGTGELGGNQLEEMIYEGYGPGGVAIMMEIVTDNRNRTAAELRQIMDRSGGRMGSNGCVAWIFEKRGLFIVEETTSSEDELLSIALDAGAEDMVEVQDAYQITCEPADFESVRQALRDHKIDADPAELTMVPKNYVKVDEASARKIISLLEALDDHDDVQNVFANFEMPDGEAGEAAEGQAT